ncbi:MAG: penicillin-binding transpeptidase domain-containing protein, partial [Candidatus Competibacterales bacterium]
TPPVSSPPRPAALAGARLTIPPAPGFHLLSLPTGDAGAQVGQDVVGRQEVSLCHQRRDPGRANSPLVPLWIGWSWSQVEAAAAANRSRDRPAHYGLKNPLVDGGAAGAGAEDVPALRLDTYPRGAPLPPLEETPDRGGDGALGITLVEDRPALGLSDRAGRRPLAVGEPLAFQRDAWILWHSSADLGAQDSPSQGWPFALRLQRRPRRGCGAGSLLATVYGPSRDAAKPGESAGARLYLYPGPGGGDATSVGLPPGRHTFPDTQEPGPEDAALFQRAVAAGLIRLEPGPRITLAPIDLARRQAMARRHPQHLVTPLETIRGEPWPDVAGGPTADLQRRLQHSAAGAHLRAQVAAFNQRRLTAAVRLRFPGRTLADPATPWRVTLATGPTQAPLAVDNAMPLMAGRLFPTLPRGWLPWQRVARWPHPADDASRLTFALPLARPARGGERATLLVIGRHLAIEGATVLSSRPRCLEANPCNGLGEARWLTLAFAPGAKTLTVAMSPRTHGDLGGLYRYDPLSIAVVDDALVWRTSGLGTRRQRAQVALVDRRGRPLADGEAGPVAPAWEAGLAALLGVHPRQEGSMLDTLSRLGGLGFADVTATLTVDLTLQQAAVTALEAGFAAATAPREGASDGFGSERFASLILIDVDDGDILASAGLPALKAPVAWGDLWAFHAANTRHSPLVPWGWHHDGSGRHIAGSTFKLVTALALEGEAVENPALAPLLAGMALPDISRSPLARRYGFDVDASCYPARSRGCRPNRRVKGVRYDWPGRGAIHNYSRFETPASLLRAYDERQYGLEQAVRDSLNTWFAWLAETSDRTLLDDPKIPGIPHAAPLVPAALEGLRPLHAMALQLGFGRDHPLDGGLLPPQVLRPGDVLLTRASRLDPLTGRNQVRQAALGFRLQTTPLRMALVAAAVAGGERVAPRLLLDLNGRPAARRSRPLTVETSRLRRGMKRVVEDGTASKAFADPFFAPLRPRLYAKTGTGDLAGEAGVNNAWLVGWLETRGAPALKTPVPLPRRLGFACVISHVTGTGGQRCGPVVAALLRALLAPTPESETPAPTLTGLDPSGGAAAGALRP